MDEHVYQESHKSLRQDAEKLMQAWQRWHDVSGSRVGVPEYWRSLRGIIQELQTKQLLAASWRPQRGEMVFRLYANGSPMLLSDIGEIVLAETALEFAQYCKQWYVTIYDYAPTLIQIMRVAG